MVRSGFTHGLIKFNNRCDQIFFEAVFYLVNVIFKKLPEMVTVEASDDLRRPFENGFFS